VRFSISRYISILACGACASNSKKKQNPNSNTQNPVQAFGLKARTANERVARTCTERLWAAVRFGKIIVPMIFASPFLLA
jgi:hypothetical protein